MDSKLEDVLQTAGVDPAMANQLVADGWTLSTFACCALDMQDFDKSIDEMMAGRQALTLLERSQLRAAFKACSTQASKETKAPQGDVASNANQATSTSSWSESFAPKLDSQVIQQLKQQFLKNSPSEILDGATMPSTRLLSLVYHQLQKCHFTEGDDTLSLKKGSRKKKNLEGFNFFSWRLTFFKTEENSCFSCCLS